MFSWLFSFIYASVFFYFLFGLKFLEIIPFIVLNPQMYFWSVMLLSLLYNSFSFPIIIMKKFFLEITKCDYP